MMAPQLLNGKCERGLAVAALLVGLLPHSSEGCIWISGTTKEGERISVSGLSPIYRLKRALNISPAVYAKERNVSSLGSTALERRNNIAVDSILNGEARRAIDELKELEAEQPGDYITAANLGTAYELAGENE